MFCSVCKKRLREGSKRSWQRNGRKREWGDNKKEWGVKRGSGGVERENGKRTEKKMGGDTESEGVG